MERTIVGTGEGTVEVEYAGRTVKVVSKPSDADRGRWLFELDQPLEWDDASPLSDGDVAVVVRGLIDLATRRGHKPEVIGVSPGAAAQFPGDNRVRVLPVEPLSFSLPSAPMGLILQMDDRGDGHLYALGTTRVSLGSDGMWWIIRQLIESLEEPEVAAECGRILTLGEILGGRATQASLQLTGDTIRIVWRELRSGVVGESVALHELSRQRAEGWLSLLRPVRDQLEARRVHRQRLIAAKTAERWARALERWAD